MLKKLWERMFGKPEEVPPPVQPSRIHIPGIDDHQPGALRLPTLEVGDHVVPFDFSNHVSNTLRRGTIYQIMVKDADMIYIKNTKNGNELKKPYPASIFRRKSNLP